MTAYLTPAEQAFLLTALLSMAAFVVTFLVLLAHGIRRQQEQAYLEALIAPYRGAERGYRLDIETKAALRRAEIEANVVHLPFASCDCGTPAGYHTGDCAGHRARVGANPFTR